MEKTCSNCRFYNTNNCAKFNINVNEKYSACGDYAEKTTINETVQKIKLYD